MSHDMSRLEGYGYDKKNENKPSKIISIIADQKNEKKKIENFQKIGNSGTMIEKAIAYRLGIIDEIEIKNEGERNSFDYGMYDPSGANLQLDTMITHHFIPGRIKKFLIEKISNTNKRLKKEQIEELFKNESYVQNVINNILLETGKRDSEDERIIFEKLPESVQNNEFYLMGYEKGKRKGGR